MIGWKQAARQALVSGTAASLFSAAMLALRGKAENDAPAGPLNGPSQWLYGRQAAYRRDPSVRHTLPGFLIHHASAMGWAILHEKFFGGNKRAQTPARRIRNAALTATLANVVDYKLTPKRLQPGFEVQLSKKSLLGVYAAFAVGLTVYEMARSRRRRTPRVN